MLITLCGPDSYRRGKRQQLIVGEFLRKHPDAAVAQFEFAEDQKENLAKLREFAGHETLFDTMKLGVVRNLCSEGAAKTAEGKKLLQSLLEKKSATILLVEEKIPGRELEFLKEKPALFEEFGYFDDATWKKFVKKEAEKLGLTIAAEAMPLLAQKFREDLWGLTGELEKWSLLGEKEIDLASCTKAGLEYEEDFMGLVRGVVFGSLPAKLGALEVLFFQKEDAAKIFHVAAYQKKDMLPRFAEYDVAVKTGKMEYEEALLDLVLA